MKERKRCLSGPKASLQYSKSSAMKSMLPLRSPLATRPGSIFSAMCFRISALSDVGPQPVNTRTSQHQYSFLAQSPSQSQNKAKNKASEARKERLTNNSDPPLRVLHLITQYPSKLRLARLCPLRHDLQIPHLLRVQRQPYAPLSASFFILNTRLRLEPSKDGR